MQLDEDFWRWQVDYQPSQYLLGLSGGVDSVVLLHLLVAQRARLGAPLVACFLDHGWHEDAPKWAALCERFCAALNVPFFCERLAYHANDGRGPEAQARAARYRTFAAHLPAKGALLTAHHQDDQAETLLLQLLRGAGLAGLSAMPVRKTFADGEHWRPLLHVRREEIMVYAKEHALDYVDDPSNTDTRYARNRLRHDCLPALEASFPGATQQIARSAQWLGESQMVLDEALDAYLPTDLNAPLPWCLLRERDEAWQKALLRRWLARVEDGPPPSQRLQEFLRQLRSGAEQAELRYGKRLLLAYRGEIYRYHISEPAPPPAFAPHTQWPGVGDIDLNEGHALLAGRHCRWTLCPPGARFQAASMTHAKSLKEAFQQAGVPPYIRRRTPLLWADDRLVWVGGLGAAKDWSALLFCWQNRAYSANISSDL
ncbi:tRNA lysidine(34) synthetase TilS [Suttonella sp. R2A3]|uniref:tRNA lysidine(34) synthetase TilS n=1 Tax=Suttonella sp. R2A3 TaxID=2908648 RepID=UPI001F3259E8|nr:tRNA lysidine(34) synthetase TilS [Suttonella sp. R2A3]UJF25436.1 tRNA lysidine(34) synthetase TilS [Suttonella sp. R2A3]